MALMALVQQAMQEVAISIDGRVMHAAQQRERREAAEQARNQEQEEEQEEEMDELRREGERRQRALEARKAQIEDAQRRQRTELAQQNEAMAGELEEARQEKCAETALVAKQTACRLQNARNAADAQMEKHERRSNEEISANEEEARDEQWRTEMDTLAREREALRLDEADQRAANKFALRMAKRRRKERVRTNWRALCMQRAECKVLQAQCQSLQSRRDHQLRMMQNARGKGNAVHERQA